jgi:methionyl-tRNA formyltransferase
MKIVLFATFTYSIPAIQFLAYQKYLQAVVSIEDINEYNLQIQQLTESLNVPFKRIDKIGLSSTMPAWLQEQQPDLVLVYTFKYKIPEILLNIPKYGFLNVHFSLLPHYRGPSPVFWQLKNGELRGGITIHRMNEEFDSGPILAQQEVKAFPGENLGLYTSRLSIISVNFIKESILKMATGQQFIPQHNAESDEILQSSKITQDTLRIKWGLQSSVQIENLVNAANPIYGGAISSLNGQLIRILEVSPADAPDLSNFLPGTIIHADASGLFVACRDNRALRLNILQTPQGFFTGFKLCALGIKSGDKFN